MEWMLDIQLGRRNLSPIQRIAIAEKYRSIYEKQARANQFDVRAKLAETAGVSTDTYSKGKKILDSNTVSQMRENAYFSRDLTVDSFNTAAL